nr:substrate-binding domain-containing protein [uncultured Faecalicatena sp.]
MKSRTLSKKRMTGIFLFIIITAILLVVYGMFDAKNREQKVYKVILIPKTIDSTNGFWTSLISGAELGAEEFNMEIEVLGGKSEEDILGQIACIEESIEKRPDVILAAPCSYSETSEALQKVVDSGIRLVLIDSVIDRDIASSVVATDNSRGGKELGEYARSLIDKDTPIGIVAHVKGSSTAIEREKGMREGLGQYESQVKDVVFCDSSYDKAYKETLEMLARYPDIGMIMGTNEYGAVGAARAVKESGLAGKVKVVGFDSSVEEIQLLEEGVFQGIIIQKPFNMGYLGIEQAANIMTGKRVEKNLDSGCKLINRNNMYEEENQRLLYPLTGQ